MIKKTIILGAFALCSFGVAFAGGILTNTNQSARFARLMALEASTKADAAYYNPAGTIKMSEGFHFTFSNQSAFQERIVNSTFAGYKGNGGSDFKQFKGTASAPIIPSLQGVYRKGKWALSGSIAVTGGGGKATFENGLPMFEAPVSALPEALKGGGVMNASGYSLDAYMRGSNYIFGGQLGGTYAINNMFSAYIGFRLNIVQNKYEGHLKDLTTTVNGVAYDPSPVLGGMIAAMQQIPNPTAKQIEQLQGISSLYKISSDGVYLDSKQSGWGVAPILGVFFSYQGLNIGAKYEFRTSLNVENKTQVDKDAGLDSFKDGVNTAHDIPALFTIGASYDIIEPLTVNVGYHHFFDKSAGMANDKQKALKGGTNEYLAGIEYRIDRMFLVSMGGQITRYGMADGFQSDLSFSVNSYSLGFGGAVNVSKNVQINVGYFFTDYENYTKKEANFNKTGIEGTNVYTRKNKVFTAGVDFSF